MIRQIDIKLNAAHPELPLTEATTFVGSPSAVFVSGVPATVGLWRITAVKVVAHYPDDSATTVECVKGAHGVWTATLPATATSGRVTHGFEILADGLDENGDAVTGYVLGYADFAVFTRDMTIDSGGTLYYMHYFDALPQTPKKGDVAPDGSGGLQLYDGTSWVPMGGYTPPAGGIPKTDLSEGVQASLGKADTALQTAPVTSVNSKTGAVVLTASDVGVDPLLFAQYYPDGSVTSAAEFTSGIKYNFDTTNHTATVKPFCNTGDSDNDNSPLSGRVVIPPFVDAQGNPYISDDGTRYKVVGVSGGRAGDYNQILTAIVAPNTVTTIGTRVFDHCNVLTSVSFPAATDIGNSAFDSCPLTSSVSLPSATDIGVDAFSSCSFPSVSLPVVTIIGDGAFFNCDSLTTIDFGDTPRSSVPSLGGNAFYDVPTTCKIIVPDSQYAAWTAASGWSDLVQAGYKFLKHSEWECARKYELDGKLGNSGYQTLTGTLYLRGDDVELRVGNGGVDDQHARLSMSELQVSEGAGSNTKLAQYLFDRIQVKANGSTYTLTLPLATGTLALTSDTMRFSTEVSYAVGDVVFYNGAFHRCTTAHTAGAWNASHFAEVIGGLSTGTPTAPTPAAGDNSTKVATTAFVQNTGANKLDSTSAAPAFSTASTYAVGDHVTYNGALYRCTTAVATAGAWDASKWTADTMTDPDAVLDVTSQNQLRVVAKDGTLLWAQGYALASASSATLACDATNLFTFADGATSQAFTLPTAPTGKVGDFGLDIDNSANTGAATMTLTGLDTAFSVVIPEGENLADMLTFEPGEMAEMYFTLTAFRVNNLPTWHIVKQVVENGGATA